MSKIPQVTNGTYNNINNWVRKNKVLEKGRNYYIPGLIGTVWAAQAVFDVKTTPKEDKKNVLINNLLIGGAMALGGLAGYRGFNKLDKNKTFKTNVKKFLDNSIFKKLNKSYLKEYLHAISAPLGAGVAGGVIGEVSQRLFPEKYDEKENVMSVLNDKIFPKPINSKQKKIFSTEDMIRSINPGMETIMGMEIGREKGVKNKVKRLVFEMVSSILVPFAAIIPLSRYLTKNFPNRKAEATAAIALTGMAMTYTGNALAKGFNQKVTDRVIEKEFWHSLATKEKELIKMSMLTKNRTKKKEFQKQVASIEKMKDKVEAPNFEVNELIDEVTGNQAAQFLKSQPIKPGTK